MDSTSSRSSPLSADSGRSSTSIDSERDSPKAKPEKFPITPAQGEKILDAFRAIGKQVTSTYRFKAVIDPDNHSHVVVQIKDTATNKTTELSVPRLAFTLNLDLKFRK